MNFIPIKIYRFLPLFMSVMCIMFGIYVLGLNSPDNFIAGHLVIFLGAVCFTIFCVASVVTSQIIYGGRKFDNIFYPFIGFLAVSITIIYGVFLFSNSPFFYKVAGHNIIGLGLICLCIAIEATVCTRFVNIGENAHLKEGSTGVNNFSKNTTRLFILIPVIAVSVCWIWVLYLLMNSTINENFIPGHVMAGMSMICTSVLCVIINSLKQINNTYKDINSRIWPSFALIMGLIALLWGIFLLVIGKNQAIYLSTGFILIGISFVCFSIFSKLLLTSRTWGMNFPHASMIPFIPLFLFLACLFLLLFLFEDSVTNINLFIPSRVLLGLGSVCFSLYCVISIISIINSTTD